jgi:hypothetical protein
MEQTTRASNSQKTTFIFIAMYMIERQVVAMLIFASLGHAWSLHHLIVSRQSSCSALVLNSRSTPDDWANESSSIDSESLYMEQFRRRRGRVELKTIQNQWQRPPNPFLKPTEFVSGVLAELRHPSRHHSGVLTLLESSTDRWRRSLLYSVGAPEDAANEQVAPTLEAALGRPNNQFAILLGFEDRDYVMDFPTDPMDYGDGTCWLECRLRGAADDELLVATGWSLAQRPKDGAWRVGALDWQDFREAYRPGIGREEWERICG